MSLDNLDAPLRITWDICPSGAKPLNDSELLRVTERLIDAGIFFLLLDEQPLLHPGLPAILNQLSAGGCQVGLVLGDNPIELAQLENLRQGISLLVDAGYWLEKPDGLLALENLFVHLSAGGHNPSLLWVPIAGQLHNLFSLFELCERQRVPRFKLPNQKITVNSGVVETERLLQPKDLDLLALQLKKRPLTLSKTALEIHDLFLWELIFPQGGGERSEYGGCQAGNSLGHIAVNADVWPCSSWPQVMGNLLQEDLLSIWESPTRNQVRTEVAKAPSDCTGCRDCSICFGGCRGLARTCHDEAHRDLLCIGPRK